jgi:cellulose biosynthesis protein BcsQ
MKHFDDARRDVPKAAQDLLGQYGITGICLIWDLRGQVRVLLKDVPRAQAIAARNVVVERLSDAAGIFWSGDVWLWDADTGGAAKLVYERAWKEARAVDGREDLRELDRHLSKGAWFGKPIASPWPLTQDTPPIVAFYSFKGGVGRTTALVSAALQLARAGKRVCVIDLDLEAPGAGSLLGMADAPRGVLDYLLEAPLHEAHTMTIDEYKQELDLPSTLGDGVPIVVVPAGVVDEWYLEKLARVDYERLFDAGVNKPPALGDLLKQLRGSVKPEPDYFLIDARAGLHDIGGLALNGLAHLDVLFTLDNEQSWAGLKEIVRHLISYGQPRECAVVQAMSVPTTDPDRPHRHAQFKERAYDLFIEVGYYEDDPPALEDEQAPHFPCALGFDEQLQRARSLDDMLRGQQPRLLQGDYGAFLPWLLRRLGRTSP